MAPTGFHLDTFDTQLSGKSPVVEILGRTHSRLVQWVDDDQPRLQADLAERWELPDETTTVFHLNPEARWQNRPPVNGRAVTAEDVVAHFRRALELAAQGKAPLAQRFESYAKVESVDSPAAGQVRFQTNQADPFLLDTLAGEFALIQAPEAVSSFGDAWSKLDSDHVIGSGPWTFDWADGGVRFTAFRDGHRQPQLDELYVLEPIDPVRRFADGSMDEVVTYDRREGPQLLAQAVGSFDEYRRAAREVVMSTFFVGAPPWNNPQLVNAINAALARDELAAALFGGRAVPVYGVPLSLVGRNAVHTLAGVPGSNAGPDRLYYGARQMWEAAGGPGLGTVTVDFPSVFDPLYSASSVVIDQLNRVLGPQFRPAVETYTTISQRVIDGYYGKGRAAFWFGWGPPIGTRSPQRFTAEFYDTGSPGQLAVGGPGLEALDERARAYGGGQLGIVLWLQQYAEVYRRKTAAGPHPTPYWGQHLDYLRRNLT